MVATVAVYEYVATNNSTSKGGGTIRFQRANDAVVDTDNPIPIPTDASTNYSFEKYTRIYIGSPGPSGSLDDLEFYTDGSDPWTGVTLNAGADGTHAAQTTNSSSKADTDAFTYTSGAALNLGTTGYTGSNSAIGSYCVMQMAVTSAASAGTLGGETMTFSYTET